MAREPDDRRRRQKREAHARATAGARLVRWGYGLPLAAILATAGADGPVLHGRVVDDATGEPLEGAVVVLIWYRDERTAVQPVRVFQDAREALSDVDGKFSLAAPFLVPASDEWEERLFKPGYRPVVTGGQDGGYGPPSAGDVLRLQKLTTLKEMAEFTTSGSVGIFTCSQDVAPSCVPADRIGHLMRLLRLQRKILGLDYEGSGIR